MEKPAWVVREVQPKSDYTLHLVFADGTTGIFDARPLLEKEMYAALKDPDFYLLAHVDYGTVVWNDEIDIAPEYLYESSKPL